MKQFGIGLLLTIGVGFMLAGCSTKDQVTSVEYNYSLQEAAKVYQEETGENEVKSILFDMVDHKYQYIFTNEQNDHIVIDAQDAAISQMEKEDENNYQLYSLEEVPKLKEVNDVLAEAKEKVGGLSPRTLTWELVKKDGQLKFKIDVKTTTADEWVELPAK
ncbi:peptidase M4 [Enterococcus casseliflavus]|uniref:peptidase M4 n=1 Tax=Enterococcus casseliflavus TaxID=37734 RepID=UPI00232C656B|nr:peptidase M4 [Enterococcus casseliflavus]MDB1688380.1 peptidase M4 [Enterococcus casseliflavus]